MNVTQLSQTEVVTLNLIHPASPYGKAILAITGTVVEDQLEDLVRAAIIAHSLDVHLLFVLYNGALVDFAPDSRSFIAGVAVSSVNPAFVGAP